MEGRTNKRRCPQRRNEQMPSAVHYVGYVEDDETPESIARKFEELDRIQAAGRGTAPQHADTASLATLMAASDPDAQRGDDALADAAAGSADAAASPADVQSAAGEGLTDEQLMEVFKQTSIFTVRSAADGNVALMQRQMQAAGFGGTGGGGGGDSGDELVSDEDDIGVLQSFWSDNDDQDYSEHWRKLKKLRKKWVVHLHAAWLSGLQRTHVRHALITISEFLACRKCGAAPLGSCLLMAFGFGCAGGSAAARRGRRASAG